MFEIEKENTHFFLLNYFWNLDSKILQWTLEVTHCDNTGDTQASHPNWHSKLMSKAEKNP